MAASNSAGKADGGRVSPAEIIDLAGQTIRTRDKPDETPAPWTMGKTTTYFIELVKKAALTAAHLCTRDGIPAIIAHVGHERHVGFASSGQRLNDIKAMKAHHDELVRQVEPILKPMRKRFSSAPPWVVAVVAFVLVSGETVLNASAALASQDENKTLAVFEFLSIAAATLWIGLYVGTALTELYQAGRAGELTRKAQRLGLAPFFHRPGDAWRVVRLLSGLLVSAAGCAVAVGLLRYTAGDSPTYGVFSGVVSIGAAFFAAAIHDPVGNYLDTLDARGVELVAEDDRLTGKMDAHIAAVRASGWTRRQLASDVASAAEAAKLKGAAAAWSRPDEHGSIIPTDEHGHGPMHVELPEISAEQADTLSASDFGIPIPTAAGLAGVVAEATKAARKHLSKDDGSKPAKEPKAKAPKAKAPKAKAPKAKAPKAKAPKAKAPKAKAPKAKAPKESKANAKAEGEGAVSEYPFTDYTPLTAPASRPDLDHVNGTGSKTN